MKSILIALAAAATICAPPLASASITPRLPGASEFQDLTPNLRQPTEGDWSFRFGSGEDSTDTLTGGPVGGLTDRN